MSATQPDTGSWQVLTSYWSNPARSIAAVTDLGASANVVLEYQSNDSSIPSEQLFQFSTLPGDSSVYFIRSMAFGPSLCLGLTPCSTYNGSSTTCNALTMETCNNNSASWRLGTLYQNSIYIYNLLGGAQHRVNAPTGIAYPVIPFGTDGDIKYAQWTLTSDGKIYNSTWSSIPAAVIPPTPSPSWEVGPPVATTRLSSQTNTLSSQASVTSPPLGATMPATSIPDATNPNATPTSDSSNEGKSHVGAIVGGVIGGVCGLALIIGLALLFYRQRKKQAQARLSSTGQISEADATPYKSPETVSSEMPDAPIRIESGGYPVYEVDGESYTSSWLSSVAVPQRASM